MIYYLFIFGCAESLLLLRLFSRCHKQGLLFVAMCIAVASLVGERRLEGVRASVVVGHGLISCGSQTLEHRLNSCGPRASSLWGVWDLLPRSAIESGSPATAGGFFTTEPPGEPCRSLLLLLTRLLLSSPVVKIYCGYLSPIFSFYFGL